MPTLKKLIPLWVLLVSTLMAFALGGGVSWFAFAPDLSESSLRSSELREVTGVFTSPLLECEVLGDEGLKTLKPFRYKIETLLNDRIADGTLTEGAVYFRDLNNGLWFGINQDLAFRPASLLKIPIMIAYFKQAEVDPGLLDKKLPYQGEFNITRLQGVEPSRQLVPGKSYTVEDLINRMIVLSDNNSTQLLFNFMGQAAFDQVLQELLVDINPNDQEHYITPHAYSGFLRVLFNASYLNRAYSEKALEILSRSEFTAGMRAGLPPGQLAATKFGEWGMEPGVDPDKDIVQLHEFGIIYYPGRPYLLGIMTRGRRGGNFSAVIEEISRMVYESVDAQHGHQVTPPSRMFK